MNLIMMCAIRSGGDRSNNCHVVRLCTGVGAEICRARGINYNDLYYLMNKCKDRHMMNVLWSGTRVKCGGIC